MNTFQDLDDLKTCLILDLRWFGQFTQTVPYTIRDMSIKIVNLDVRIGRELIITHFNRAESSIEGINQVTNLFKESQLKEDSLINLYDKKLLTVDNISGSISEVMRVYMDAIELVKTTINNLDLITNPIAEIRDLKLRVEHLEKELALLKK